MTDELPKGWTTVELSDVAEVRLGRQRSPKNHTGDNMRPYLRAANVGWMGLLLDDVKEMHFSGGECATYELKQGDVLLSEASGSMGEVGKPAIWRGEIPGCCFQNTLIRVRSREALVPEFILFRLRLEALNQSWAAGTARGVGIHHLGSQRLSRWTFALPPVSEQQRIVEEVERRLSHVNAAEQGLREAIRVADLARLSVLRAGTRGADIGLVVDDPVSGCVDAGVPFERDSEHNHIVWVRLGDIAKVGSGTTPTRGDPRYWEDGDVPWVTSGQVSAGVITNPSALVTQAAFKETSLKLWPAGTLLMAMYGEGQTRGRCAELRLDATCNQACAAIQLRPEFENYRQFVLLFLQSRYDEHRQLGGGGVQENLNLGLVRDIRIPLAGESTQRELVIEMDRKLSLINSAQLAAESSLVRTAALRRSILAAAFSGELVPQNPNDEPADVLLERIRAGRAAAQSKKKTRTKRKEAVS